MKRYLIPLLMVLIVIRLSPASGQHVLLGISDNDVVAGGYFYAFYNMTAIPGKPIVGFKLSLLVPKGWTFRPYNASGITPKGERIKIGWLENGTAVYDGSGASVAHVAFRIKVPLNETDVRRSIFAKGYLLVKEGNGIRKYIVTGKKEVFVHKWEPLIYVNLSKEEIVPPAIVTAYVRILTAPPLYPTAMRNVDLRIETTTSGLLYNESVKYWPYGHAIDLKIPIKISSDVSGGEHKLTVTLRYEVGGNILKSIVEYPFKVLKPSKIDVNVNVSNTVKVGYPVWVNASVINPSSFTAYNVELHAKVGDIHEVKRIGDIEPGSLEGVSIKINLKDEGNYTLSVWAIWEQEYPKEFRVLGVGNYTVEVVSEGIGILWYIPLLMVVIIVAAAVKYKLGRSRNKQAKEDS